MFFIREAIRATARQITRTTSGIKSPVIYPITNWAIEPVDVFKQSFEFPNVLTSDNLCLSMMKSGVSGNLLLEAPRVFSIRELIISDKPELDFTRPAVFDYTCLLTRAEKCSGNYVKPFALPKIFKYDKVIAYPNISKNLFLSLDIPDISGCNYESSEQINDSTDEGSTQSKTQRTNIDKIPTRSPSDWELIQPVLLPPLSLEFPEEFDFYRDLRGYQQYGISWLVSNPSALLADEMGTGKTVQTVNALRILFRQGEIRCALIVCPPAVIGSVELTVETGSSEGWRGHFYHWASELEVAILRGGNKEQRKLAWESPFHIYITTYDTLRTDISNQTLSDLEKFDCIVLDEAQKIKNEDTKTSKAIRCLQSEYRWALTGTPIENKIDDIKSLFSFIRPGTFSGTIEDSPEAVKAAVDPHMLRRLKQDVLQDLPDKVRQEDWLDLDGDQRADYNRALLSGKKRIEASIGIEQGSQVRQHIFALISELKQLCNFAKGKLESPKTDLLLEYVETISENKKKVLIFSQYREEGTDKISKLLIEKQIRYVVYTGKVSEQRKNQAVHEFRSDPDVTVFLATIDTAGYGLTLTEATYVIHFDHPWNPAKMQNAEDRTHRIGQKSGVTVYSFWMKGTIEERIKKKLLEKRLLVENTVDELAIEAIENGLSTEDWLDVLGVEAGVKTVQTSAKEVSESRPEEKSQRKRQKQKIVSKSAASQIHRFTKKVEKPHKMYNDRIKQLEKVLKRLRDQIAGKEDALTTIAPEEKVRIKQQISDLRLEIKPFEEEYWQLLRNKSKQVEISEPEAKVVVAELVEQVGQLQNSTQYPDEVIQILREIYLEVSKPNSPASAKLKGALSMLPPFVSLGYEAEIDTESFFRTYMPTFTKWYKALAKR